MIKNLESIKEKIDIVEILSHFLPLKKEGANFTAICPFHAEKSGSFVVNPKKQFYHCFGCNASGDAIKFVQEYKHLSFQEAVQEIASLLNLHIEEGRSNAQYYEALESLNALFKSHLLENAKVTQYLLNRGLQKEDFKTFEIGLIPNNKQNLLHPNLLKELGLLYENGILANANRISFALKNSNGKIIGFSCRTHPYSNFKSSAKYINSRDSKIFHKSQMLYNLHFAKQSIREKGVILCEGFMDSIALQKLGYKNAIATSGTAFNATHLSSLVRLGDIAYNLLFDKDSAGELATFRALELLFKNEIFNAFVLVLENQAKDAGEVLEKKEELKLKRYNAFKWYLFKRFHKLKSPKEKESFAKEIKALINRVKNYYLKEDLIAQAQEILKLPQEYFTGQKVINAPCSLHKQILKSVLESKDCEYLALNYLEGEELGELKESFSAYLRDETLLQEAREILGDSSIEALSYGEFKLALLEILKQEAKRRQQIALRNKNIQQILYISEILKQLNAGYLTILSA